MPCPYFIPTERFDDAGWAHPARLPLGAGWRGHCGAPGHTGAVPTDEELKQACNLGYARNCSRMPAEHDYDALRFSILRDHDGLVSICYIAELNYLPRDNGSLLYDALGHSWPTRHPDGRVQTLAECFLKAYLDKRTAREVLD